MTRLDSVERAVADIAAGKAVIVIDDEERENEGDLIFAAEKATPELVAFMVRYTSGYLCVPLDGAICDRLGLLPMYAVNQDKHGTAYTVTVDARNGVGTGISASDRATTMRLLANPTSIAEDFTRPGHVVPLRAKDGGVLRRPGHTEAAVDLARMAGLQPAGAICEIVSQKDEGSMAQTDELRVFADEHGLALITIADLIEWRRKHEKHIERIAEARIPTRHGEFRAIGYASIYEDVEHVALVRGDIAGPNADGDDVLVRVHSECLTGDVFGSRRCDCGPQLDAAMAMVAREGRGVVLYMRGHEGRGIGLMHKLQARPVSPTSGRGSSRRSTRVSPPSSLRRRACGSARKRRRRSATPATAAAVRKCARCAPSSPRCTRARWAASTRPSRPTAPWSKRTTATTSRCRRWTASCARPTGATTCAGSSIFASSARTRR